MRTSCAMIPSTGAVGGRSSTMRQAVSRDSTCRKLHTSAGSGRRALNHSVTVPESPQVSSSGAVAPTKSSPPAISTLSSRVSPGGRVNAPTTTTGNNSPIIATSTGCRA